VFFGAQPSKRQQEAAAAAGRKLDLTPIGREAFVLFVNADNPVPGLTTTQVQDIYSRGITNWKQVGGRDEQIIPFQRPEDSGSQTVMQARVMQGRTMAAPLRDEQVDGMGGILSEVAEYRNSTAAIGYSFRWYATVMNGNPGIRLLAIDGVEPTPENIRNGSYPYTVDVYAVTARRPTPTPRSSSTGWCRTRARR
jgi:phosphate transport system substrate-binding protein